MQLMLILMIPVPSTANNAHGSQRCKHLVMVVVDQCLGQTGKYRQSGLVGHSNQGTTS